jgi:plastocyanin
MKLSNAARLIFWLAAILAIGILVRAESSEKRANTANTKSALLRIVDESGRPVVNGVRSPNGQTIDVTVGPDFAFHPDEINISVGDTVQWTWAGSGHSVSSGPPCVPDSQFCSPNDMSCFPGTLSNAGTIYQHTFNTAGSYHYLCISHCLAGMTGVVNVTGSCGQVGWSAGPDMPVPLVRAVGVYFQPNGKFYTVGGRTSDTAGSDFQHVLEYTPSSNSWTQKPSTLPGNEMNNMACGVLTVSGTPQIYCVGGSAAGQTTATGRVFSYNPVTDTPATLTGDDWPGAMGTILPGGFAVANNKFYILGGFNINVASTNQIWEFDPTAAVGAKWTQRVNTPVGIMYAPTCTINGIIYVGGASDYQGGTVVDTTNSFSFNPVANTIGTIAAIPRATGETRGLNFNGQMYVMGGGRVAPNPSNEVDVYNPGTNSWSLGMPFVHARRNFPTDTNGTDHIWLSGGYDTDGITPLASMEIFCQGGATPTPTPTPTATATATPTATATGSTTATPTATATGTATATASPTATLPPGIRPTPTPRPRPTPAPRP